MRTQRLFSRFYWLGGLIAVALVVMPGCDTLGNEDETATFTLDPVTFTFEPFDAGDAQDGEVQLASENDIDLNAALRSHGFNKDEIISAEATEVVLIRLSVVASTAEQQTVIVPSAKVFDFLNEAEVQLTASGQSTTTIASRAGGFDSDLEGETELETNGRDVTDYVKAGSMGARLHLLLEDIDEDAYRVEVEVAFQVTGEL